MFLIRLFSPGRILFLAIVFVAGYLTFSAGTNLLHSYQLVNDENQMQNDVAQLQGQVDQLQQIRDYLRTDEYVEYMAHNVFGLVKPGEQLVVVSAPPAPPAAQTGAVPDGSTGPKDPTQYTWWQRLFGGD
ncbi:MAG TPA: septum formation initiator family protein [Dehalococcoidia bacterium]|nr:septum formation initiator family protein [Dehalococcoidia bacterium]